MLKIGKYSEIIEYCVRNNTPEYNQLKALEEATEFIDAVIKRITKHPDTGNQPSREDILGEYSDFIYRGYIYLKTLFPDTREEAIDRYIAEHIERKLDKLIEYKNEEKYKGGL